MIERQAYSIKEFCAALGIWRSTANRWLDQGIITAVRVGGRVFIPAHVLTRVLNGDMTGQNATGRGKHRRKRPTKAERDQYFVGRDGTQ